jgi:transcriptional regulator with XRE-family HTH domain
MSETGNMIKTLRERFGFTQDAVAAYLSVKREMISYYERGSRDVPLEVLERLSTLFGVELELLVNGQQDDLMLEMAFAFRAENLEAPDLEAIAFFRKVVMNYQRMLKLEQNYA